MKTNLIIAIASFSLIVGLTIAKNNNDTKTNEYKRSIQRETLNKLVETGKVYKGKYNGFISYIKIDGANIYIRSTMEDGFLEKDIYQKGTINGNKVILNYRFGLFEWKREEPYITEVSFNGDEMIFDGIEFEK